MKKILFILICCISQVLHAQSFVISNIEPGNTPERDKAIGCTVSLKFYDTTVRLTVYNLDGEKEETLLLYQDSQDENYYTYKYTDVNMSLKLKKVFGYISSATIEGETQKEKITIYLKRK